MAWCAVIRKERKSGKPENWVLSRKFLTVTSRFITHLSDEERTWAARISDGFGQKVCGFDMLRCDGGKRSQVIDVNGWSFVKGNDTYYGTHETPQCDMISYHDIPADKTAEILASLCLQVASSPERPLPAAEATVEEPTWLLKANVTVFRHADRTPKQKLKFNFPIGERWTQPFVTLLNGEREEIILRERTQLNLIATAVEEAKGLGADGEDLIKLTQLNNALFSKIDLPGTKAQLKPVYSKKQPGQIRKLTKLTLVFKWGGEFTHSARYQSRDLGENMKKDISIMSSFSSSTPLAISSYAPFQIKTSLEMSGYVPGLTCAIAHTLIRSADLYILREACHRVRGNLRCCVVR